MRIWRPPICRLASAALAASSWRLRKACSCSAAVFGPALAASFGVPPLASLAAGVLAARAGSRSFSVLMLLGGGLSEYCTLPSESTHLYIWADAGRATHSASPNATESRFMRAHLPFVQPVRK